MKKMFFILMCCAVISSSFADKIRYFVDKKTGNIGAKNHAGKIIVPAIYGGAKLWGRYQEPIRNNRIEFFLSKYEHGSEIHQSGSDVYDFKGKYLYTVLWYDMNIDDWSEGIRRYIEHGKIGFVNEKNEKITAAMYDDASQFHYGYSQVWQGKIKRVQIDDEHYALKPEPETKMFVIDKTGKVVSGSLKPQADSDIELGGKYFPTPYYFANDFERELANKLNDLDVLNKIRRIDANMRFQITKRPNRHSPYYELTGFTHRNHAPSAEMVVLADKRGRFYAYQYNHQRKKNELKPLKTWILDELYYLSEYFIEYPYATGYFNPKPHIKIVKKMRF